MTFKVFGMDDAITMWVSLVLGESSANKHGKANTKCLQIKDSLLQSAVSSTADVPCAPMARLLLGEFPVECSLDEGLLPDCLTLLPQKKRDVREGGDLRRELGGELLGWAWCLSRGDRQFSCRRLQFSCSVTSLVDEAV